jgi:hypothetical protein
MCDPTGSYQDQSATHPGVWLGQRLAIREHIKLGLPAAPSPVVLAKDVNPNWPLGSKPKPTPKQRHYLLEELDPDAGTLFGIEFEDWLTVQCRIAFETGETDILAGLRKLVTAVRNSPPFHARMLGREPIMHSIELTIGYDPTEYSCRPTGALEECQSAQLTWTCRSYLMPEVGDETEPCSLWVVIWGNSEETYVRGSHVDSPMAKKGVSCTRK